MSMKKIITLFACLFISLCVFAQGPSSKSENEDLVYKIVTKSVNENIQIDLFFSESINPKSVHSSNILVNGNPIKNTKFTFNRDGNQVRFIIDSNSDFEFELKNIKTNSGKTITTKTIKLSGDSEWTKY